MKHRLLILALVMLIIQGIMAQSECQNYLEQARVKIKIGRFTEAIEILKTCSQTDTSEIRQWRTYRLLATCYLELDSVERAETEVKNLLTGNPLYKTSILEDSKKLRDLIHDVHRIPRYTLSIYFSGNRMIPRVINSYAIINTGQKSYNNIWSREPRAETGLGWGLSGSYGYSDKLSFHFGAISFDNVYALNYKVPDFYSNSAAFESVSDEVQVFYQEKLNYLQIPVFLRYSLASGGNFNAFLQAGYSFNNLIKSSYDLRLENSRTNQSFTPQENIDNKAMRRRINHGLLYGVGLGYRIFEGQLYAELNFQNALSTLNKRDPQRLDAANSSLHKEYYYIDDDLKLNSMAVTIGYTFYFNYFVKKVESKL